MLPHGFTPGHQLVPLTPCSGFREGIPHKTRQLGASEAFAWWLRVAWGRWELPALPVLTSRGMRPWYQAWLRRSVLLSFSSSSSSL